VRVHVARADANVTELERVLNEDGLPQLERTREKQREAERSLGVAQDLSESANVTSSWLDRINAQSGGRDASDDLIQFVKRTGGVGGNKTLGVGENQATSEEEDSIEALASALEEERRSLRAAHAAATEVEKYLVNVRAGVRMSILDECGQVQEREEEGVRLNRVTLEDLDKQLRNRTVGSVLEEMKSVDEQVSS
jgi:hypothetical protein